MFAVPAATTPAPAAVATAATVDKTSSPSSFEHGRPHAARTTHASRYVSVNPMEPAPVAFEDPALHRSQYRPPADRCHAQRTRRHGPQQRDRPDRRHRNARYEDRPPIERSTYGPRLGFNAGLRPLATPASATSYGRPGAGRNHPRLFRNHYLPLATELLGERATSSRITGTSTIDAVDALYVEAIQTHLGGFIPLD